MKPRVLLAALVAVNLVHAAESPLTPLDGSPLVTLPTSWTFMGNGGPQALPGKCELGIDSGKAGDGQALYTVRCTNAALPSFGGARMRFDVAPYRGKRVRVSAELMASGIQGVADPRYPNVAGEAGLWISVGTPRTGAKSDRMENRTIKGSTGWETRDFVVDIPADAGNLLAGYWMQGKGQVWMRNLKVEEVPTTVAVNFHLNGPRPDAIPDLSLAPVAEPRPTDHFLPPPDRWLALGEQTFELCDAGIDAKLLAAGQRNLSIACSVPVRGSLRHTFEAQPWWGKRVRLSGWLKTDKVESTAEGGGRPGASLFLSTTADSNAVIYNATLTGTTDWTYEEIVIDIPAGSLAPYIPMGLSLNGTGQVWVRDLKFEEVSHDTPVTLMSEAVRNNPGRAQ